MSAPKPPGNIAKQPEPDGRMPRFAPNEGGRDFAVGDIHGYFSELRRALKLIGFDSRVDRLFSIGDLIDRGPESDQVLQWLDQPWFHAICGNHESVATQVATGVENPVMDHRMLGGDWLDDLTSDQLLSIGARLSKLPLAIEVMTPNGIVGLVHADCPFDDWNEMRMLDWSGIAHNSQIGHCCLWSIERYVKNYTGQVRNVRAVVHGHMTVAAPRILGNAYFIDTGGWLPRGRFTFLELRTLTFIRGPRRSPSM